MNVVCSKCNHSHHFDVEVVDYTGFSCEACFSYFTVSPGSDGSLIQEFVHINTQRPSNILPKLNELVSFEGINYRIISVIVRKSKSNDLSTEYVGLSTKDEYIYFSHGNGYYCVLDYLDETDFTKTTNHSILYEDEEYIFDESDISDTIYAEGFVYEDIRNSVKAITYENRDDEDFFISEELIDNKVEFYDGKYLGMSDFNRIFSKSSHTDLTTSTYSDSLHFSNLGNSISSAFNPNRISQFIKIGAGAFGICFIVFFIG